MDYFYSRQIAINIKNDEYQGEFAYFFVFLVFFPTKLRVAGAGVPQSPPGFSQTFPQLWLTVQNQAAFTGNEMAKGQFTTFLKFCQQKDISKAGNADSIE